MARQRSRPHRGLATATTVPVTAVVMALSALLFVAACSGSTDESGLAEPQGGGRAGTQDSSTADSGGPSSSLEATGSPEFVGRETCTRCHPDQTERWLGSHHDLAMQDATPETVLGDFNGTTFTKDGVTSTFSRRGDSFFVQTDGPDGELTDYEIAYTFGVTPLQQYLVEFPGGRYQALPIFWDTRSTAEGGQRWGHLYPDERIPAGDQLHWTGLYQNWNYMCAECHSTKLRRNYVAEDDRFETSFSEIDVSCEACHGPASRHVAWAEERERQVAGESGVGTETRTAIPGEPISAASADGPYGLTVRLRDVDLDQVSWNIDPETGLATRTPERRSRTEIETCARCHSRRAPLIDDYQHGRPLADSHRVALLDETLYFPDGQIRDEVYVCGSFLQSRMYAAGVTCSDCHDPHSARVYIDGNALCARCHTAAKFDTPGHHFHEAGTPGAACVDCHMPTRTYMVVDPRLDHSMRIPRPDLSESLGTPNACTGCHADHPARWAADQIDRWYDTDRRPHYGEVIEAGRRGTPGAGPAIRDLAGDAAQPAIVRGTALSLLGRNPGPGWLDAIRRGVGHGDPLVRAGALRALRSVDISTRLKIAAPALSDRVRSVRLQAAELLAGVAAETAGPRRASAIANAAQEYEASLVSSADRPESLLGLGSLYAATGRSDEAERSYRTAIEIAPWYLPAPVNLADLYRQLGRDRDAEPLLREAMALAPDNGDVHFALGLLLVRTRRMAEAVAEIERAVALRPDVARYALAHAIVLRDTGDLEGARAAARAALERHPGDPDLRRLADELGTSS